jgi:hypothetical protein
MITNSPLVLVHLWFVCVWPLASKVVLVHLWFGKLGYYLNKLAAYIPVLIHSSLWLFINISMNLLVKLRECWVLHEYELAVEKIHHFPVLNSRWCFKFMLVYDGAYWNFLF